MDIKYQNLFCLKNNDNKEYLAMSSAAVVRLKYCVLILLIFFFLSPSLLRVTVFDN